MAKSTERRWWEFSGDERAPADFPTPDCFTEEEWAAYYAAEQNAIWSKKTLKTAIAKDMCGDCTLSFQKTQIRSGKCKPQYGVITPLHRMAMLAAGEDDPIEQERQSRAAPWAELPLLRGTSIGLDENGTGNEETAGHGDNSLVLPE